MSKKKKFKGEAKSDFSRRHASDGEIRPKRHPKNKPFGLKLFWEVMLGTRLWKGSIQHWYATEKDRQNAFDRFENRYFLGRKEYKRIDLIER